MEEKGQNIFLKKMILEEFLHKQQQEFQARSEIVDYECRERWLS